MKSDTLQPQSGAINTIVAEYMVTNHEEIATKGAATPLAIGRLIRQIGAGLMQIIAEQPPGTVEVQLTATREDLPHGTLHAWRVDIWKARQRQFLRVPQRRVSADQLLTSAPAVTQPTEAGPVQLGAFACPHCAQPHQLAPFTQQELPRQMAMRCSWCTLPIHLHLVDVEAKQ